MGWDDLPVLQAHAVALRNADLATLRRLNFEVGGVPVRFQRALPAADVDKAQAVTAMAASAPATATTRRHDEAAEASAWEPAVWLWLEWSGVPLLAGVSTAWAGAMAQTLAGAGIDQLSDAGVDLLCQIKLAPRLPAGLMLRQAARARQALDDGLDGLELLGVWAARHLGTDEASGHAVQLWAGAGFALQSFLSAFAPLSSGRQASPLAGVPMTLPLVAARWHVDADQLLDLAVGDVLILG